MTATRSESNLRVLSALRKATDLSIKIDKRTIILTPHLRVDRGGGVYDYEEQTPREPQDFVVEPVGATLTGISSTSGGITTNSSGTQGHSWSYYLVGRHDCQMEIGDTWQDGDTTYRIVAIQPTNGYERRGVVTAFGSDPNYGS